MLHPKAELLDVFPLLRLLPIVKKDVRLRRVVGSPDADPIGAPVLHLPVGPCLDAADEVLDGLEGAPMAQEQVDEAWEPPVVVHCLPGSVLGPRRPDLILLGGKAVLPCPTLPKEPWGDPVHAVDRPLDLGLGVGGGAHHAGERHHSIRSPRLCPDHGRCPREEPRWGRGAVHRQIL